MAELQLNCNLWLGLEIIISDELECCVVFSLSIRMCSLPLLRCRTADCLCVCVGEGSGQITLLLRTGEAGSGLGSRGGRWTENRAIYVDVS